MSKGSWASVLAVDDDLEVLRLIELTLARVGLRTTPVVSGYAALAALDKQTFDLILLDNDMPGLRGVEVMQRLKDNPLWWKIPVVFVTANHLHAFAAEVQRLGAVGLVLKPFSVEELLRPTLTALRRPPK